MRKKHIVFMLLLLVALSIAGEGCNRHKQSRLRSKKGCNCDF